MRGEVIEVTYLAGLSLHCRGFFWVFFFKAPEDRGPVAGGTNETPSLRHERRRSAPQSAGLVFQELILAASLPPPQPPNRGHALPTGRERISAPLFHFSLSSFPPPPPVSLSAARRRSRPHV